MLCKLKQCQKLRNTMCWSHLVFVWRLCQQKNPQFLCFQSSNSFFPLTLFNVGWILETEVVQSLCKLWSQFELVVTLSFLHLLLQSPQSWCSNPYWLVLHCTALVSSGLRRTGISVKDEKQQLKVDKDRKSSKEMLEC